MELKEFGKQIMELADKVATNNYMGSRIASLQAATEIAKVWVTLEGHQAVRMAAEHRESLARLLDSSNRERRGPPSGWTAGAVEALEASRQQE